MNNELRAFIKESLERGQARDSIRDVLLQAGWQEGEVRNGLAAFAETAFPVAVPRPTPYVHAREAFFYLVSFIALYVSAISFGILVFGLIDHSFPDAFDYGARYPSPGQATAIASVIVAFPLYLFLTKRLARELSSDPERRQSLVRRWLTYLTLVVAAGIIIGDLIGLLANLLAGDPTLRFGLKALTILAVTSCIFGFYLWEMRQAEALTTTPKATQTLRVLAAGVAIIVVACLAYALFLTGTPGNQRDIRLDRDRISHLTNISRNIDTYWELNQELPETLDQMSGPRYSIRRIHDPESMRSYEYRIGKGANYELCAEFQTDTAALDERNRTFSDKAWDHGIGRTCFALEAQAPERPPVGPVRTEPPRPPSTTNP